jgi:hypothetical protein
MTRLEPSSFDVTFDTVSSSAAVTQTRADVLLSYNDDQQIADMKNDDTKVERKRNNTPSTTHPEAQVLRCG